MRVFKMFVQKADGLFLHVNIMRKELFGQG